jgi:hypothetical protein
LADFLADLRVLFFAELRVDLFAPFLEDFFEDFLAAPPLDFFPDFLADFRLRRAVRPRFPVDSSKSPDEAGVEAGVGAGVFSIGSGSIQPEPDQPISM